MQETLLQFVQAELIGANSATQISAADELLLNELLDSMSVMRLIVFIEERFELQVPPEDLTFENFHTVGTMVGYLNHLGAA